MIKKRQRSCEEMIIGLVLVLLVFIGWDEFSFGE
jgi:hypothetical protein